MMGCQRACWQLRVFAPLQERGVWPGCPDKASYGMLRGSKRLAAVYCQQVLAGSTFGCMLPITMLALTCEQVIFTPSLSPHSLMKPIITCRKQPQPQLQQKYHHSWPLSAVLEAAMATRQLKGLKHLMLLLANHRR